MKKYLPKVTGEVNAAVVTGVFYQLDDGTYVPFIPGIQDPSVVVGMEYVAPVDGSAPFLDAADDFAVKYVAEA